jgi:hypothetical protein
MQRFLNWFIFTDALHVSGGSSAHLQEHITVHTASGIVPPWRQEHTAVLKRACSPADVAPYLIRLKSSFCVGLLKFDRNWNHRQRQSGCALQITIGCLLNVQQILPKPTIYFPSVSVTLLCAFYGVLGVGLHSHHHHHHHHHLYSHFFISFLSRTSWSTCFIFDLEYSPYHSTPRELHYQHNYREPFYFSLFPKKN